MGGSESYQNYRVGWCGYRHTPGFFAAKYYLDGLMKNSPPIKRLLLHPIIVVIICIAITRLPAQAQQAGSPAPQRPNILLIVADDLGYADIGCYGGDIATPNLDALAMRGLRFSRFHTAPYCAVTRAMLLSGNTNHTAGMGSQDLVTGIEGYEGHLSERIVPVPQLLKQAGYHTYIAGKWHLGTTPGDNAAQKGFERSFTLLEGAANHYSATGVLRDPPISPYTEDGKTATWPEGTYSTTLYTDKLMGYMDSHRGDGQPFFAMATYTSPHWPLQVDEAFEKPYRGRYNAGYEALKKQRMQSLAAAGMILPNAIMPPSHPLVRPWDSLSTAERRISSRKMEIYAGMVANLDFHIGRLIDYLKTTGQYDNTLIIVMSDNGAAAEDFYYDDYFGPFLRSHFTDAYEQMGRPNSFIAYGRAWAEAGSAPFRYYKGFTTEGGTVAPMIIAGPQVAGAGTIVPAFASVMDIAPTLYALAGISYPSVAAGKAIAPLKGASLLPLLAGSTSAVHDSSYVFALEHRGRIVVRKGRWKLVSNDQPFDPQNFQLFDLKNDLAEQVDVKDKYPDVWAEMLQEWKRFAATEKIKFPTPVDGEGL